MEAQHIDPLKPKHEKFAMLVSQGMTQAEAYRISHNCKDLPAERVQQRASKLAARPDIRVRVIAFLKAARISELDSAGQFHHDLAQFIAEARAKLNFTAVAAFMRLRGQVLGILQENVHLTQEGAMTDAQIMDRLAGKDANKRALLSHLLSGEKYQSSQGVTGH